MSHALILGASGISGWSLLNQARIYPTPTTFSRITGTTKRATTLEKMRLPEDDRIQLVSDIDLTASVDQVVANLQGKVADIDTVTHVFYTAYIHTDDHESLRVVNTNLLSTAVRAVERVTSKLQTFVLQTGGKGYGLEFPKNVKIQPPLKEDCPRIPEPWKSKIFYYTQYDLLEELSRGKEWTFSEIRPDGIVGFAPGSNAMNMAQGIALYLLMYREVHGQGATVPFPGRGHGYHSTHSDTFQDVLSKMEIFAALNPDKCGNGGVFNVADGHTVSWSQVWPKLCDYFGLVGSGPDSSAVPMIDFVEAHKATWKSIAKENGLDGSFAEAQGWGHTNFMLVDFDFDRQYDLSKSRSVGFHEAIDTAEGYFVAWRRMAEAGFLPK